MSATPEHPILERLRGLRGAIDGVYDDVREIKVRLETLDRSVAAIASLQMAHHTALASRLDHHDRRLDRIERRLDLIDA